MEVKIERITIKIGEKELTLSLEEARELVQALEGAIAPANKPAEQHYHFTFWPQPVYYWWNWNGMYWSTSTSFNVGSGSHYGNNLVSGNVANGAGTFYITSGDFNTASLSD